jgi:CubicO group peptidase (beta-lactamase class C family)
MSCPFIRRSRVPASLDAVTSRRAQAEADPRRLGIAPASVEAIWESIENLYRSGLHPAIAVCVRHRGEVLLDRAIGHVVGNGPDDPPDAPQVVVRPDSPFCVFSASKAMTAMLIHLLDQRRLIHLDDPVSEYLPEFAIHTKQWITIRHVLIHRAGIPTPPREMMTLDRLADPDGIMRILCSLPQTWRPGRQLAYHAVTGGFILGEIVHRVTGKTIRAFLEEEIRRPLGMQWMSYGAEGKDVDQIARNYFTGPPPIPPLHFLLGRALGIDFRTVIEMSNDPRFYKGIIPSGNVVASADDVSRFYQLLLDGGVLDGVRVFEPRTIRRAVAEQSYLEIDFTLTLPFRYSMGFMLGGEWLSIYGPDTRYAFGHIGFTNVIGWADPEREVAAALLTSGKPLVYPEIYYVWNFMRLIARSCPKVRENPWRIDAAPAS